MSTTFEWRDGASLQRREAPADRPRDRSRGEAGAPAAPVPLRRPAPLKRSEQAASRALAARLRQRLNRARLVAATILALSILGLIYLTQISHVARYGYRLSDLQRQQASVERENQLLEYQITTARNLNQVGDLAARTYGMVPLVKLTPTATGGGAAQAATGGKGAPQARYITVQRPATVAPSPTPAPVRVGLIDRIGRHLIGVGVASAER